MSNKNRIVKIEKDVVDIQEETSADIAQEPILAEEPEQVIEENTVHKFQVGDFVKFKPGAKMIGGVGVPYFFERDGAVIDRFFNEYVAIVKRIDTGAVIGGINIKYLIHTGE